MRIASGESFGGATESLELEITHAGSSIGCAGVGNAGVTVAAECIYLELSHQVRMIVFWTFCRYV